MTIQQLLERLEKKRDALDVAISEIRQASAATSTKKKAASIIRSVQRKPMKYKKGKHWTQTPEGREILRQRQLKFWKGKK